MKRLVLALATVLLAGVPPAQVSASRCFTHTTEFDVRAGACTKMLESSQPPAGSIPITDRDRGKAYARAGRRDRAIADLDTMIRFVPDEPDAYFIRARAHFDNGQYDLAITDYDTAIRLKPDAAGAYVNRGNAYASKGQFARAFSDYDTAIRLKPDLASAYINRGIASAKQDLLEWALRDFGRAYDLNVRLRWMVETLERHGRLP